MVFDIEDVALEFFLVLFLATWIGYLPAFAFLFVRPQSPGEPRVRALLPRTLVAFVVQLALSAGVYCSRFVWTSLDWPKNAIGYTAVSLPAAACLYVVLVNGLFTRALWKWTRDGVGKSSAGISAAAILCIATILTAVLQVQAASPQSPFPNEEVHLLWILQCEALFSIWLLFREAHRVGLESGHPLPIVGTLRRLYLWESILFASGYILVPTF